MRDNVIGTYLHGPVLAKSARSPTTCCVARFAAKAPATSSSRWTTRSPNQAATVAAGRPR